MTFLFCLLLAYVVIRASEDISAAIRKQPPPRQKIRTAKLKARAAQGGRLPQSPAGRYFTGLVDDAWDSAHHRRQLMAQHRAEKRQRRAARTIARSRQRQARKDAKRTAGHSEPAEPAAPETTDPPAATAQVEQAEPVGFAAQAPQPVERDDTSVPEPDGADEPAAEVDQPDEPEPGPKEDTPANLIAFPHVDTDRTPHRMELPTMSTGEITGLNSAIDYATQLATYCTHTSDQISSVLPSGDDAANSCERARESLAAGGVTGEALSHVESVQEQMTHAVQALHQALSQLEAAGAAAEAVTSRLSAHLSVQEAYQANPDAGHREFVTAD